MKRKIVYQISFAAICVAALVIGAFGFALWPQCADDGGIRLAAPAFVKSAQAQDVTAAGIDTVLGEAGFSAYFRKDAGIDLDAVRNLYVTVESDPTDPYIIGEILIDGYGEGEAPHVYINPDGWVLAYYRALTADSQEVPVSKSIDIRNYDGNTFTTKLKIALNKVAAVISIPQSFTPTYYHFQYPNATHLTIIGEQVGDNQSSSFEVNLPGTYDYKNISWTFWAPDYYPGSLSINDNEVTGYNIQYAFGSLGDENKFIINITDARAGLVLLYNKP